MFVGKPSVLKTFRHIIKYSDTNVPARRESGTSEGRIGVKATSGRRVGSGSKLFCRGATRVAARQNSTFRRICPSMKKGDSPSY